MMRRKRCSLVSLIFLLALPALARSGDELPIEEAIAIALSGNPDVLAAAIEVEAACGRTLQLAARPEPGIYASIEGAPLSGRKQEGDETEIALAIEQAFEFPGKRALRTETGRIGERLAAAELDRVRRIVTARVKRAYWQAVFARETVKALERSSARLELLLGDLQSKYRSGMAVYADVLRARAEKARLRNQILEGEKERRLAALALNELLARPAAESVVLASSMPFIPLPTTLEDLWQNARSSSPSLRLAALRQEHAATGVKLARLTGRPDLSASFSLPSSRMNAWGVSLGLALPFLRPGRNRGLALEAGAGLDNARLAASTRERRVRSALESAYASAMAAADQVLVFQRDLLRELEDELRIQLEYFRFGKTEAYALLDLHRTFVLAELEHLRAVMLYNIALADLDVAGEEND